MRYSLLLPLVFLTWPAASWQGRQNVLPMLSGLILHTSSNSSQWSLFAPDHNR